MRIVQINSSNFGSTGNIMIGIAQKARESGHTCYTACPDSRSNRKRDLQDQIFIGTRFGRNLHLILGKLTGLTGMYSAWDTYRFLRKLDQIRPDIIHLHNLHEGYINLPMLFRYIKKNNIRVIWTLHDCWAFTAQCAHFTVVQCNKWQNGCFGCPQYRVYPETCVDRTKTMWKKKRRWFNGVADMTIVTPSQWLADLAAQSFLREYPVRVVHNGIDLSVFHPMVNDFRQKYNIPETAYILLGVSFGWGERKGLDVFLELANRMDPEQYRIVLVGTNEEVDKLLPEHIISIHRTHNQQELARVYSAADLFLNPTREENYPTVNMETLACGTPIVTFRTGGSPEIPDETCGSVVPCSDVDAMESEIIRICREKPFSEKACLERARSFDRDGRFAEYVALYH